MSKASNPSTLTSCRLSPGQLKLLRPGVERIFAAYSQHKKDWCGPVQLNVTDQEASRDAAKALQNAF